ncbi:MAG: hypothetical protein NT062_14690, partial [Proteobacteria bacterium]|nr:hypothetical protein [Pseudomonadota bacterium]
MTSLESSPATAAQGGSPDRALLDRGLAIARHGRGLTFIAVPAAVASPAAILDLPGLAATVAWASPDGLVLVGVGLARELRASGPDRWTAIARAARTVVVDGAVIRGEAMPLAALDKARPRFLGGGAFATGGADLAPWTGFGDAWFALPRWTYVRDGNVAQLVLAVDAVEAADQA